MTKVQKQAAEAARVAAEAANGAEAPAEAPESIRGLDGMDNQAADILRGEHGASLVQLVRDITSRANGADSMDATVLAWIVRVWVALSATYGAPTKEARERFKAIVASFRETLRVAMATRAGVPEDSKGKDIPEYNAEAVRISRASGILLAKDGEEGTPAWEDILRAAGLTVQDNGQLGNVEGGAVPGLARKLYLGLPKRGGGGKGKVSLDVANTDMEKLGEEFAKRGAPVADAVRLLDTVATVATGLAGLTPQILRWARQDHAAVAAWLLDTLNGITVGQEVQQEAPEAVAVGQ